MSIQNENDKILENYLNKKFLHSNLVSTQNIELIIRPECNQKCEYCYIVKYGEELYPLNSRLDKKGLLKNIDMLLEYFLVEQKVTTTTWDIFAGDLFYDDIWFDIIDLFYKYYSADYYQNEFLKNNRVRIILPTNFSFVRDDNKIKRFEEQYEKMLSLGIRIHLSYSTDGLYATESREKTDLNQDWFDKTLSFCAKHGFGVHPMVSYENIHNYIENYQWWIENMAKHFNDPDFMWSPMFLQVRNDGWTTETIEKYIELLNYMIDFRLELFDGDLQKFAEHLGQGDSDEYLLKSPYSDLIRLLATSKTNNSINCSLPNTLTINCANLKISPCHRLTYNSLAGGQFQVQDDKIIGIKSLPGLSSYLNIMEHNRFLRPDCIQCEVKDFCMQGCLGAQFEYSGDPFKAVPSVCRFLKTSYGFLIKKYFDIGVMDILLNPNYKYYNDGFVQGIKNYLLVKDKEERMEEEKRREKRKNEE